MNKPIKLDLDLAAGEYTRRSFYRFVRKFWSINIPEQPVWNWHIKVLCDELQAIVERIKRREPKVEDLVCNIPPGTTKSTIFSVMLPAYCWAIDPTIQVLTISYSESVAVGFSIKSRNIIESDLYKKMFPNVVLCGDKNLKTNYANTMNGERFAGGMKGTATGKHFHLIIIDDPINPKEAVNKDLCETTNSLIDGTLSTRKVDRKVAVTCTVMQRLSENDPTAHLLGKKGKKIRHICLPAELKDGVKPIEYEKYYTNGLLDIVRLSREVLDEALIELTALNYAGQYSQQPAPATGNIWQKWFIEIDDRLWPLRKQFNNYGTDWDTAYTDDTEKNAASAYVTAGKIGNDIYIDDLGFDWLEYPELLNWMTTLPAPHYIEDKASGKDLKTSLVRNGINAILVSVIGNKIQRASMATPCAKAGRVYIRKSLADKLYNDAKQGILKFPRGKFKDLADALAQALIRLDTKPITVTSSNEFEDIFDNMFS